MSCNLLSTRTLLLLAVQIWDPDLGSNILNTERPVFRILLLILKFDHIALNYSISNHHNDVVVFIKRSKSDSFRCA